MDMENRVAPEPTAQVVQSEVKKCNHIPIIVVLSILTICGFAFGGYELYLNLHASTAEGCLNQQDDVGINQDQTLDDDDEESHDSEAERIIKEIADRMVEYENKNGVEYDIEIEHPETGVWYKPDYLKVATKELEKGNSYHVELIPHDKEIDDALTTQEKDAVRKNREQLNNIVSEVLDDNGPFENVSINTGVVSFPTMVNNEKKVVCSPSSGYSAFNVGVECTDMDLYIKEGSEEVQFLNSLAEAVGERDYIWTLETRTNVHKSEVEPYERIEANGLNAVLFFYRVGPSSDWIFFAGTQSGFSCDQFDTDELKRAFAGEQCYDGNGWTKVQP